MKTIVIGASGATGYELVKVLLQAENVSEVKILVRRDLNFNHPKLIQIITDFKHLEDFSSEMNADLAFSCLGTTLKIAGSKEAQWKVDFEYQLKFAQICAQNQISSFVLLSALGANPKSKIFYNQMKGRLETEIIKLNFNQLLIFKPSLLIRPNTDRKGEKISENILKFLNQLNILNSYKAIKVSDLAKSMFKATQIYSEGITIFKVKEILDLAKR